MVSKDTLQYLSLSNGKKLAFQLRKGSKTGLSPLPTIVFLGGYRSDMTGTKAAFLDQLSAEEGYSLLRFDYSGQGKSDGDFKDGCIGVWTEDALAVINHAITGDMILIGSSMGGWIGLLLTQILGDRIKAFIGIATAPDFTVDLWNRQMTEDHKNICRQNGYLETPEGDYFTLHLFEDAAQHLIFDKPLNLPYPVILLQGKLDEVVPYETARKLADHITSLTPPEVLIVEDGDHRLARDEDLVLLAKATQHILNSIC